MVSEILYVPNRWEALVCYCDDGTIETDSSAPKRTLRRMTLERKNQLFVGAVAAGERAAALYSLTETAKLNGMATEGYLRQVYGYIVDHSINRIDQLLPWNITPMLQKAA